MYEQVEPNQDLASYQGKLIETLLRNMAFSIQKTVRQPDPDNIHDLRRLCLRLRHVLRVFARLLPRKPARKIQKRLRALQDLLGAVRSCDVAAVVLKTEQIAPALSSREARKIAATLGLERRRAVRPLRARLRKFQRSDTLQRWRTRLLPA